MSLAIEGFRSFEKLNLTDLSTINVFFGQNNSGKTSVLEAVYTHASGFNFGPVLSQVLTKRTNNFLSGPLDTGDKLRSIFRNRSTLPYTFKISGRTTRVLRPVELSVSYRPSSELADLDPRSLGQATQDFPSRERAVQLYGTTYQPISASGLFDTFSDFNLGKPATPGPSQTPPTPLGRWSVRLAQHKRDVDLKWPLQILSDEAFKLANFCDILSHRTPDSDLRLFSFLKRYGELEEFTAELASSFPNVKNMDMIPYPDGTTSPMSVLTPDGQMVPSYAFGDGMRRWYFLLGQMMIYRGGVHCIEEIDATLHPAVHKRLSQALLRYAKRFECQLFLTTHSIEFTDAFLDALYGEDGVSKNDDEDPVRIFTLRSDGRTGLPEIWPLTGREAHQKRIKFDLDLR